MSMKRPPHPGRMIRRAIGEGGLGITVTSAAEQLGVSRKQLSQILNERAGISPEMAIRLSRGIGSTPDHWLRMQAAYDLAQ
jgi:addiction module HigA family antidote